MEVKDFVIRLKICLWKRVVIRIRIYATKITQIKKYAINIIIKSFSF